MELIYVELRFRLHAHRIRYLGLTELNLSALIDNQKSQRHSLDTSSVRIDAHSRRPQIVRYLNRYSSHASAENLPL